MRHTDDEAKSPLLAGAAGGAVAEPLPAYFGEVGAAAYSGIFARRRDSDSSTDSSASGKSVKSSASVKSRSSGRSLMSMLCGAAEVPDIYSFCAEGDEKSLEKTLNNSRWKALTSQPNLSGFPPLHYVILYAEKVKDSPELIKKAVRMATLLLENGADLNYKSFAIASLTDEAEKRGLTELTRLFEERTSPYTVTLG